MQALRYIITVALPSLPVEILERASRRRGGVKSQDGRSMDESVTSYGEREGSASWVQLMSHAKLEAGLSFESVGK